MSEHDREEVDRASEGIPGRGGMTDANTPGAGKALRGGAHVGEAGIDDSLGAAGEQDPAGDADIGGAGGLSVARETAGGSASAGDALQPGAGLPVDAREDADEAGTTSRGAASAGHPSGEGEGPPGEQRFPDAGRDGRR